MRFSRILVIFVSILHQVFGIPIDNGVEGEPEIECGGSSITVNFNTQQSFEGHVYVKGLFNEAGCRSDENGHTVAGITLPFDSCNVIRTRSLNPKGIFVSTTVVITFHPHFVTKIDRAYRIECFYMESDKTVSADLAVSDLTTAFQSQLVPMPICRYQILDSGPTGEPITFAQVGDQVYHKWTCETETVDTFCMIVHNCFVDDGNGDTVTIIDDNGCAIDRFVLNNLEYPADLVAGQEAHVYKYADRSQLFYQCQITITIKEPGDECARPQCSEATRFAGAEGDNANLTVFGEPTAGVPQAGGPARLSPPTLLPPPPGAPAGATPNPVPSRLRFFRRSRRQANITAIPKWKQDSAGTLDVRTELNALDLLDEAGYTESLLKRPDIASRRHKSDENSEPRDADPKDVKCIDKLYFNVAISGIIVTLVFSCVISLMFTVHSKKTA